MLIKLLILPIFFIICGFGEYIGEYTNDNQAPKNSEFITDDWQVIEEPQTNEKVAQEKKFKDLQIKNNRCGEYEQPFKIGVVKNYYPFLWKIEHKEKNGAREKITYTYKGVFIDFINNIIKSLGNPKVEYISFNSNKEIEKALQRAEIDIGLGIPYNPDSFLNIEYLYPAFMANPIIAILNTEEQAKQITDFNKLENLKGLSYISKEGLDILTNSFMSDNKNIQILNTNSIARNLYNSLLENKFSYILTSLYSAQFYRNLFALKGAVFFSEPVRLQQLFIGFSKNSTCRPYSKYFTEYIKGNISNEILNSIKTYIDVPMDKQLLPYIKKQRQKRAQQSIENSTN